LGGFGTRPGKHTDALTRRQHDAKSPAPWAAM
jgi:hypothetical protein